MNTPTVSIIGQSNTVMRQGFANKMAEAGLVNVLSIRAIGSSASLLANFFVSEIPVAAADYCILDLAVFDMALESSGAFKINHMERYLATAITEIRLRKMEPILLLLPPQWLDRSMHPVYLAQQRVAVRQKCHYFDGLRWLRKTVGAEGISFVDAFSDGSHLNPEYSGMIAAALSESISILHGARSLGVAVVAEVRVSPVELVALAAYVPEERIRREASSIISLALVRIDRKHHLQVLVGRCERICGLVLDSCKSRGKISIEGTGLIVKDMTVRGDSSNLTFVARVVPLVGDVQDLEGNLRISVADIDELATEASLSLPARGDAADALYVSHLLVERPTHTVNYVRLESGVQDDISLLCRSGSNHERSSV